MAATTRYHPILVTLHWLLAAAILADLSLGEWRLSVLPNSSPDKLIALRVHLIAGILIVLMMTLRLILRYRTSRPPAISTSTRFLAVAARINHGGLYILVYLMAATGLATAMAAHVPAVMLGRSGAALPSSFEAIPAHAVHEILAAVLLALIALHVLAALFHQFVRKDALLQRMWFKRERFGASSG